MKQCPNCRKTYGDELFFCLDDGSPLSKLIPDPDPNAPTEAAFDIGSSLRTEVLPGNFPTPKTTTFQAPSRPASSKLPYIIIALLIFVCGTLAAILVGMNLDRIFPQKGTATANVTVTPYPTPQSPSPSPGIGRNINAATTPESQPGKTPRIYDARGKWIGDWSTESGTLFDFELTLTETSSDTLDGRVVWFMRRTARPDKRDKIGLTATEYVRGTIDRTTGLVNLSGYKKDDRDGMLVMLDVYRLTLSADGNNLNGQARNGGKWNGRVRLSR